MTLNPRPIDSDVLYDQNIHQSEIVWDDRTTPKIIVNDVRQLFIVLSPQHHNILPLLHALGFYSTVGLWFIQLDWQLITTLGERWRPETHTFHMPIGECSVSLQDVKVLVGLSIDGNSVTS